MSKKIKVKLKRSASLVCAAALVFGVIPKDTTSSNYIAYASKTPIINETEEDSIELFIPQKSVTGEFAEIPQIEDNEPEPSEPKNEPESSEPKPSEPESSKEESSETESSESESSKEESGEPESSEAESGETESSETESSEAESSEAESSETESSESGSSEADSGETESNETELTVPQLGEPEVALVSDELEQVPEGDDSSSGENTQEYINISNEIKSLGKDEKGAFINYSGDVSATINADVASGIVAKDLKARVFIYDNKNKLINNSDDITPTLNAGELLINSGISAKFERADTYSLKVSIYYEDEEKNVVVLKENTTNLVIEKQTIQHVSNYSDKVEIYYDSPLNIEDIHNKIKVGTQPYLNNLNITEDSINTAGIFAVNNGKLEITNIPAGTTINGVEKELKFVYAGTDVSEESDKITVNLIAKPRLVKVNFDNKKLSTELSYRDTSKEETFTIENISDETKLKEIKYNIEVIPNDIVECTSTIEDGKYKITIKPKKVGGAKLTIRNSSENTGFIMQDSEEFKIKVENSPIQKGDFQVIYNNKSVSIEEWINNLNTDNVCWINQNLTIKIKDYLHDNGIYNVIGCNQVINSTVPSQSITLLANADNEGKKIDYEFWMKKVITESGSPEVIADTSVVGDGGKISVVIGFDSGKPQKKDVKLVEPHRKDGDDDQNWYYSQPVNITVEYTDDVSGIKEIQYTTDNQEWNKINQIKFDTEEKIYTSSFQLTENGSYAVAVRAIDYAGNISEPYELVTNNNKKVTIVIDKEAPECNITVQAENDKNYEPEKWTNKKLTYTCEDNNIFQVKYKFVSIKDDVLANKKPKEDGAKNEDASEYDDWDVLPSDGLVIGGGDKPENINGYFYFVAESKSGLMSNDLAKIPVRLQQTLPEKMAVNIKNEKKPEQGNGTVWYNFDTQFNGLYPEVNFSYEDYIKTCITEEYNAPIKIYRKVYEKGSNNGQEKTATIGFKDNNEYAGYLESPSTYNLGHFSEAVSDLKVTFVEGKELKNGEFVVEYWIQDEAGNESEMAYYEFNIDTKAPEIGSVSLTDGTKLKAIGEIATYDIFSQNAVSGTVESTDSLSGIKSTKIMKTNSTTGCSEENAVNSNKFTIDQGNRCLLYIVVEDNAGNKTTITTNGIVVDNEKPTGDGSAELIVSPKGANSNGFFNKDLDLEISIKDAPENDYSSLQEVKYVLYNGSNKEEKVVFESSKTSVTLSELESARTYKSKIAIDAKKYEGNEAYLEVTAKDKAGNERVSKQEIKIDITKPVIKVNFDNNNAVNDKYFNADRTATIHISELNFDANKVTIKATKNGAEYPVNISSWKSDGKEHYATIAFKEDGDYTLTVKCTDLADNEAEQVTAQPFVIDKTASVIKVVYSDVNPYNEKYYNKDVVADIIVTEKNFSEKDFKIMSEGLVKTGNWTHSGSEHKLSLSFTEDGFYYFDCNYTDLAGNKMEALGRQEFYIDKTEPVVAITGIENDSANAGSINPIVTIQDKNFDANGVNISVQTGRGKVVDTAQQINPVENGFSYVLTDLTNKGDDVYYLTASGTDMAGNNTELVYRFSLNRNGSTYDLTNISNMSENTYYRTLDIEDMVIVEMNVDKVEKFAVHMTRNGTLLTDKQVKKVSGLGNDEVLYKVDVSGNENIGYTYKYTIFKENFSQEGTYNISFYSKDAAGNEVNSTLDEKAAEVHFIVDNTVPKAVFDGIESDGNYDEKSKTVNVMVTDNFKLAEAEISLVNENGEELQSWNYLDMAEAEGSVVELVIPEYKGRQSILFRAKDAAGNEIITLPDTQDVPTNFVISTNPVTYNSGTTDSDNNDNNNNNVLFIVISALAGLSAIAGAAVFLRKKYKVTK